MLEKIGLRQNENTTLNNDNTEEHRCGKARSKGRSNNTRWARSKGKSNNEMTAPEKQPLR